MKTIPLEQISTMPMLIIFELLTALIVLTLGIFIVQKTIKQNAKKKLLASVLVGMISGGAMIAVMLGVNAHVEQTNRANLQAAVTETGESLTDEELAQLETSGAVSLGEDRTISFLNDGELSSVTVYDASEYDEIQKQEDSKRAQQIKDNDF